jgi:hypothetical protein
MIFLLIAMLLVGGCGIVPNGYGGYCTAGPDCDRQHEQLRSLGVQPGMPSVNPVIKGFQDSTDYATSRKPTCTSPTGYGVGC